MKDAVALSERVAAVQFRQTRILLTVSFKGHLLIGSQAMGAPNQRAIVLQPSLTKWNWPATLGRRAILKQRSSGCRPRSCHAFKYGRFGRAWIFIFFKRNNSDGKNE